jgi:hypothetical protein
LAGFFLFFNLLEFLPGLRVLSQEHFLSVGWPVYVPFNSIFNFLFLLLFLYHHVDTGETLAIFVHWRNGVSSSLISSFCTLGHSAFH